MISKIFSFVTITLVAFSCNMPDKGPWTPLFNETDFSEFEQRGGKAIYRVEDGTIIGTTVPNTENSFMSTRKTYSDFILESPSIDTLGLELHAARLRCLGYGPGQGCFL